MRGIKANLNKKAGSRRQSAMTALSATFFVVFLAILFSPMNVYAKGNVHYGSNKYSPDVGYPFNVGVYVETTEGEGMSDYEVKINYDPAYLEYINGEETEQTGEIVIKDKIAEGSRVRIMLTFKPVIGGETEITVKDAKIRDGEGNLTDNNELPSVSVSVRAPLSEPPEFIKINGEKIADFDADKREYEISLEYTEEFEITASEGYEVLCTTDKLKTGSNDIVAFVVKEGNTPIEYKFSIDMKEEVVEEVEPQEEEAVVEEKTEEESIKEAIENVNKKEKNPEIEALNLKAIPMQNNSNNQSELKNQRTKSIIILIGFAVLIILIIAAKLIYEYIINNENSIRREGFLGFKLLFVRRQKSKLTFAEIGSGKTASEKYFEYGLDEKAKNTEDKGKDNNGSKDGK